MLYEKIIDEIKKLINDKKLIDIPKSNLESIINNSTLDGFKDIQKIVKELKLYQNNFTSYVSWDGRTKSIYYE